MHGKVILNVTDGPIKGQTFTFEDHNAFVQRFTELHRLESLDRRATACKLHEILISPLCIISSSQQRSSCSGCCFLK